MTNKIIYQFNYLFLYNENINYRVHVTIFLSFKEHKGICLVTYRLALLNRLSMFQVMQIYVFCVVVFINVQL